MVTPLAPNRNERDSLGGGSEVAVPVFVSQSGFLPSHDVPDCRASAVGSCCWPTDAHGSHSPGAGGGSILPATPCNPSLTRRQLDAMMFIQGHIYAKGWSPTYRTICDGLGVKSTASVFRLVKALVERGYIAQHEVASDYLEIEILRPVAIPRIGREPLMFIPNHVAENTKESLSVNK